MTKMAVIEPIFRVHRKGMILIMLQMLQKRERRTTKMVYGAGAKSVDLQKDWDKNANVWERCCLAQFL